MKKTINIYCDESCHIEHDRCEVMSLAAIFCEKNHLYAVKERISYIKQRHNIPKYAEIKWNKISPCNVNYFKDIITAFFADDSLHLRGYVAHGKNRLDHEKYFQSYNEWYYKIYYRMLETLIDDQNLYNIFIDIKDTIGGDKTSKLREIINRQKSEAISKIQIVRSDEVLLVQIADLFAGALSHSHRNIRQEGSAKTIICQHIEELSGYSLLSKTPLYSNKVNWFIWTPRG